MLPNEVANRIETGLRGAQCHVNEFSGGTDHYSVVVICDAFEGKTSLVKHRMVMELFKEEIETGEVHALSITAYTNKQWETRS